MKRVLVISMLLLHALSAWGGEFQNLSFDEAQTNNLSGAWPPYGGYAPVSDLLPGWELVGPEWPDQVGPPQFLHLNLCPTGLGFASLYDRLECMEGGAGAIHGQYTLGLWPAWAWVGPSKFLPFTVSQTGTVPPDAALLKFWANGWFEVKINEEVVVTGAPPAPPWSAERWADVSAWSGQEVTLTFTTVNPRSGTQYWLIDHIRFEPIPEPDVGVMMALGGAVLWLWRCRKKASEPNRWKRRL